MATLNALNRKLKRGYLKSSTAAGDRSPGIDDDVPHYDGRISEFTEKYVPWSATVPERIHPAAQYSPIPISAESLNASAWRSQAKVEQEQFEQARERQSANAHSAGLRYSRDALAPTFFAWNPEANRIPGYEVEGKWLISMSSLTSIFFIVVISLSSDRRS